MFNDIYVLCGMRTELSSDAPTFINFFDKPALHSARKNILVIDVFFSKLGCSLSVNSISILEKVKNVRASS